MSTPVLTRWLVNLRASQHIRSGHSQLRNYTRRADLSRGERRGQIFAKQTQVLKNADFRTRIPFEARVLENRNSTPFSGREGPAPFLVGHENHCDNHVHCPVRKFHTPARKIEKSFRGRAKPREVNRFFTDLSAFHGM